VDGGGDVRLIRRRRRMGNDVLMPWRWTVANVVAVVVIVVHAAGEEKPAAMGTHDRPRDNAAVFMYFFMEGVCCTIRVCASGRGTTLSMVFVVDGPPLL
jgi:hypothetical protein